MKPIVQLSRIKVEKLYGYIDFDIDGLEDNIINFLIAKNGMGKTTTLNFLVDISTREFTSLHHSNFLNLTLGFKIINQNKNAVFKYLHFKKEPGNIHWLITDSITIKKYEKEVWAHLPVELNSLSTEKEKVNWLVTNKEAIKSKVELASCKRHYTINRKGHYAAYQVLEKLEKEVKEIEVIYENYEQFQFLLNWNVQLIPYSRILIPHHQIVQEENIKSNVTFGVEIIGSGPKEKEYPNEYTVIRYIHDMQNLLKNHVVEASDKSISEDENILDSIYANQLLNKEALNGNLEKQVVEINTLEAQLKKHGLIPDTKPISIPSFSTERAKDLFNYIIQSKYNKVKPQKGLLDKLQLFETFLNDCFAFKQIKTSRIHGITCHLLEMYASKTTTNIPLNQLSSGEQHLLILAYKIFFEFEENTYILIDEPETSMHLDWQEALIDTLEQVGKMRNIRFLCATHSPTIIGHRINQMKAIKPQTAH